MKVTRGQSAGHQSRRKTPYTALRRRFFAPAFSLDATFYISPTRVPPYFPTTARYPRGTRNDRRAGLYGGLAESVVNGRRRERYIRRTCLCPACIRERGVIRVWTSWSSSSSSCRDRKLEKLVAAAFLGEGAIDLHLC